MSLPSIKILLIDRDAGLGGAIRDLLSQAKRVHFDVESAETVEQGLVDLASDPTQAVLLDVAPRNGGLRALRRSASERPTSR